MMLLLEENTFKCENLLLDTALIIIFISGLIGHVSISFVSLSSLVLGRRACNTDEVSFASKH